ncbi:MAG: NADH-quinone oxidoreductase subunit L [Phycisphaerales bacterium]|nr:NADH-quinone oxidoreductase subunit L [Planctomycetota bacterium]
MTIFSSLSMLAATAAPKPMSPILSGPPEALLVLALPILGVILCTLCAIMRVRTRMPAFLTVGCLAAAFAITVGLYLKSGPAPVITSGFEWINLSWGDSAGENSPFHQFIANFSLYLDALTVLWMLFVTGLATLIALYASEYMSGDVGTGYCRFFAAFNLFVFSMSCLVMGDNMLMLFLGWEGVGLCSYLLIGYFYKKPSAVEAAKKAFILNRIGDLGLLMGICLTYVHFGSIEYRDIFAQAQPYIDAAKAGRYSEIPAIVQLIPVLLAVGAFGKSAQLPLYVWLPDAMEGPTPVSALIHAATMVTAGVYLVARMYPLFLLSEIALPLVGWVGALTALFAATIGMAQFDIKRIMAYSTVSQLGYMFAGLGVLTSTGAAFHVVTHAFFKALLFLSCGAIMHGFAGQLDLRKLSGLRRMKGWGIVSLGMLVGCLNLAGFPFTSGFFSKDMLIGEAFVTPGTAPIGWILLLTAGLTAYYTFRVFFRVIVGPVHYEPGDELHSAHEEHAHGDSHNEHAHGDSHNEHAHVEDDHQHHDHGHGGHFHPHAPGWAINTVLLTLSVLSLAASGLYFVPTGVHGGAVPAMVDRSSAAYQSPFAHHAIPEGAGDGGHEGPDHAAETVPSYVPTSIAMEDPHAVEHPHENAGTFLGWDPHAVLFYVSGAVGFIGIFVAYVLHYAGRTTAATARADALLPMLGPIPRWAQHKWYVDEFYNLVVRVPLLALAHTFHLIDKLLVDGLVRMFGAIPRWLGTLIRPTQSGELHGYAAGMATGIAVLLFIVFMLTLR